MKMKKLKMPYHIYQQYKNTVKDNEDITQQQAELKMTRNAQLALATIREKESRRNSKKKVSTHYQYGCLHFIVADGRVVWMRNNSKAPKGWKRDNKLYLKLNSDLGINENVTMFDLIKRDIQGQMKYRMNKVKWAVKLKMQKLNLKEVK